MSDEEHHFESKADAGGVQDLPSAGWHHPQERLHRHQVPPLDGLLVLYSENLTSKTGKHGHSKCHFVAVDIFNGKKLEDIVPPPHNCDVPRVTRTDYQLTDIS
ncbi:hypothetical protein MLD38_004325 [Melastoma candidum]|uniref:Uncharacterized protein n=1 Tax=Melastoma candidum TaxID=119954 RepID=A0ACB9S663_9MYRT|nr:hypothetical protein MLD38_004325 [Melastoma candidum]